MLRIRPAQPGEHAMLTDIALQSKAHWPYPAEQIALWRPDLTQTAESIATTPTFVAMWNEDVAGFIALTTDTAPWRIEHLWVLPKHMGQGIGQALLQQAVSVAQAAQRAVFDIDADPYAEGFYLACGAQRIGTVAAPIASDPARIRPQLRWYLTSPT